MSASAVNSASEQPQHDIATVTEDANGQAIHLPREFRVNGEVVRLLHVAGGILLVPMEPKPRHTADELQAMWDYIDSLGADPLFPDGRDQGVVEPESLFN